MAIIEGLSFVEYCEIDAVNASSVKDVYAKSEAHAKYAAEKDTTALRKGSALHCAVLEPQLFDSRFYTLPAVNARTNEGKAEIALAAAENVGKAGISSRDLPNIHTTAMAIRAHPFVGPMLADSKKEVTLTWEEDFGPCRARLDILCKNCIADLKSTRDAHLRAFSREVYRHDRNYWIQAAIYWRGAVMNKLPVKEFYFIACELVPPFATSLHYMDEYTLQESWLKIYPYCAKWAEAKKTGIYNSYPPVKNMLVLPEWLTETSTGDEEDGE